MRKSFLSALYGIAVENKEINLNLNLEQIGIDDVEPRLSTEEKQATIRDLLQARSGIYHPALAESAEMTASKPLRGSALPGMEWHYNNWDFNALGTIYEKLTNRAIYSDFNKKIAIPIGMEDYTPGDGFYFRGPKSCHPAYHFEMTARDMARFGLLYLNMGLWRGTKIVPSDWINESTIAYSHTTTALGGYGYMWWTTGHLGEAESATIAKRNSQLPKFRYYAQGGFGQMICIIPDKKLVLVTLSTSKQRADAEWGDFWRFVRLVVMACPDVGTELPAT